MMRPPRGCWSFMILIASCVQRNVPVRLVSTTAFHCSKVRSSMGTGGAPMPALLKRTSSRPKLLLGPGEERADGGRIADVGGHDQRLGARGLLRHRLQHFLAASGQDDRVTLAGQCERRRPADARTRARDQCDLGVRWHDVASAFRLPGGYVLGRGRSRGDHAHGAWPPPERQSERRKFSRSCFCVSPRPLKRSMTGWPRRPGTCRWPRSGGPGSPRRGRSCGRRAGRRSAAPDPTAAPSGTRRPRPPLQDVVREARSHVVQQRGRRRDCTSLLLSAATVDLPVVKLRRVAERAADGREQRACRARSSGAAGGRRRRRRAAPGSA